MRMFGAIGEGSKRAPRLAKRSTLCSHHPFPAMATAFYLSRVPVLGAERVRAKDAICALGSDLSCDDSRQLTCAITTAPYLVRRLNVA